MARAYDIDEWQEYCSDDDNGTDLDEPEGFYRLGPKMGGMYRVDGEVWMILRMVIDIMRRQTRSEYGASRQLVTEPMRQRGR